MRENRTPGSVQGASGNWRPYRDGGSNLCGRVESSTRKSADREATWRSNVLQVHSLHDRKRPSNGQADTAHACPIACHCQRQSLRDVQRLVETYGGKRATWVKKSSPRFELGRHHYEYHWYEHPGIGRVELKQKRVH